MVDKAIVGDMDTVAVTGFVSPKQWKQGVRSFIKDLVSRALVTDAEFSNASIIVNISTTNPYRFETFFRYKRTGVARISSTTAEAGFNFGTIN